MPGHVQVRNLVLSDPTSVRAFATELTGPVDVRITKAGVMIPPFTHTANGLEPCFDTNHLGRFALTNLLLRHVRDRVVTVSSNGHKVGTIDFDDPDWERKP